MATTVHTADPTSGDVKKVKNYVIKEDARLDKQLRLKLDAMRTQLQDKNTELMGKLAALENLLTQAQGGGADPTAEPPGLAGFVGLQAIVRAMEETLRATLPKAVGIGRSQENAQRKIVGISNDFESLKMSMGAEMEQMRIFITQGLAAFQSAAAAAPQAQPMSTDARGVDPFTVHGSPWDRGAGATEQIYVGTPVRSARPDMGCTHQRWALYDERYVLSSKGTYDKYAPQVWLQTIRNYFVGRTEAVDRVLDWVGNTMAVVLRTRVQGELVMLQVCVEL